MQSTEVTTDKQIKTFVRCKFASVDEMTIKSKTLWDFLRICRYSY
jgi:hypothetical protein